MKKYRLTGIIILFLCLFSSYNVFAQRNSKYPGIDIVHVYMNSSRYYIIHYKDAKPDDVPQEVFDALFEVQLEVVNNFTYDYDVYSGRRKAPVLSTLEDFYRHGKGVCAGYADFFVLIARERGLTENLYYISGSGLGGHAWIEYRTAENRYIIDPTWSDDYSLRGTQTRERFRETRAYGRCAFFITYDESRIIFRQTRSQKYDHNTFKIHTVIPLWTPSQEKVTVDIELKNDDEDAVKDEEEETKEIEEIFIEEIFIDENI